LLYPIQQPLFGFVESKRNLWLCTSAGIQYAGKLKYGVPFVPKLT